MSALLTQAARLGSFGYRLVGVTLATAFAAGSLVGSALLPAPGAARRSAQPVVVLVPPGPARSAGDQPSPLTNVGQLASPDSAAASEPAPAPPVATPPSLAPAALEPVGAGEVASTTTRTPSAPSNEQSLPDKNREPGRERPPGAVVIRGVVVHVNQPLRWFVVADEDGRLAVVSAAAAAGAPELGERVAVVAAPRPRQPLLERRRSVQGRSAQATVRATLTYLDRTDASGVLSVPFASFAVRFDRAMAAQRDAQAQPGSQAQPESRPQPDSQWPPVAVGTPVRATLLFAPGARCPQVVEIAGRGRPQRSLPLTVLVIDARQDLTVSVDDQRALRAEATLELGDLAPGRIDPLTTLSVLAEPLDQPPTTSDAPAAGAPPATSQGPSARWRALRLLGVYPLSGEQTTPPQRDATSPSQDPASDRDNTSPACET